MLRTVIVLAAGAAAFAAPAAQVSDRQARQIERRLAGLVPGEPQTCISPDRSGGGNRYGDTLLTRGRGGTIYVSNFNGCAPPGDSDAMITRRPTTQICRGDIVEFQDLVGGLFRGACPYSEFTPYRRPR